ncbi:putative serine protease K12H4.7 [Drosophila santomea]|uniref:putative serine protease K12H4.7 n=1 Tax=Drosophila santomea TaxID=129105 RepID=UPI00195340C4|nr:putative serine protease K12H4.7 [Drosophila santomea]
MRYMVKEDYFKPNGTIFFFMGGEGSILSPTTNVSNIMLTKSFIHDLAKKYGGYLVHSEHRYYGESKATKDLHLKSLKYLTVPQAMADVAHLIQFLKANYTFFGESKVFLVGGSYSGFMVPWFAKLYPNLIDLGWGSSAPFQFKVELKAFYTKVFKIVQHIGGRKCRDRIIYGFETLRADIKKDNTLKLVEMNICGFDHVNKFHVFNLFERLTKVIGSLVQYENKTNIQSACKEISETSFTSYLRNKLNGNSTKCYDSISSLKPLRDVRFITDSSRLWFYQCCSQLGNFQTSEYIPLDFWLDMCTDVFGYKFSYCFISKKVKNTDDNFRDLDSSEKLQRVFLTQPELDAWSATKVRKHKRTYVLKGASHCEDLQPSPVNVNPYIKNLMMDIDFEVQKLQKDIPQ